MELREYLRIWTQQHKVFWAIVLLSVFAAVIWQKSQPTTYQAVLLLNIGREGSEETAAYYTYDSFYRLQADERFADTVVRWLGSPRVVEDVYRMAGLDVEDVSTRDLKNTFEAKRLSSQMIEVTYADADARHLQQISASTVSVLNDYAGRLNQENRTANWFVVIGSDPVIRDASIPLPLATMVGLALGIFIGFWGALLRQYIRNDE